MQRGSPLPSDRKRETVLPSVGGGRIRSVWRYYTNQGGGAPTVSIDLNCWRATIFFSFASKGSFDQFLFDRFVTDNSGTAPDPIQKVVVGGAYYRGRPVYMNEKHTITATTGSIGILVIEEYFDGVSRANNG